MSEEKAHVQQVVVGGVIYNTNKKVLVVCRPLTESVLPGFFELPSGKKEIGEGTLDALKREIKEETGLYINEATPFSIFDYDVEKPDYVRETTQINFLVFLDSASPKITLSEHNSYAWVNETELEVYKLSDKTRETIKTAFRLLPKD